jgi:hypothetical protein
VSPGFKVKCFFFIKCSVDGLQQASRCKASIVSLVYFVLCLSVVLINRCYVKCCCVNCTETTTVQLKWYRRAWFGLFSLCIIVLAQIGGFVFTQDED